MASSFRDSEFQMRKGIIEDDLIDCVIGLGENLFYNSAMEACIVVCRTRKPAERKRKILLIDARNEIREERTQSYLDSNHILKIHSAYESFKDIEDFSKIAELDEIRRKDYSLNIKEYIIDKKYIDEELKTHPVSYFIEEWNRSSTGLKESLKSLRETIKNEVLK